MRVGPGLIAANMLISMTWGASARLPDTFGPSSNSCPVGSIEVQPGQAIQRLVDQANEGAVFCLKAGVHRLQEVVPKNAQSFIGESGTILSGAHQITTFERDGPLWVATGQYQSQPRYGQCAKDFPVCNIPNAFFIDDRPLRRVLSKEEVGAGRFYLDYASRRLYFADDPRGHKVEATVARFAFAGRASDVLIRNLIVEKYSNPAQRGAIDASTAGTRWTIDGVEARWNSGAGVSVGSGGRVVNCNVHHNGQLGVGANGRDILLKGNEIWANNIYGFDSAWEAGGVKVAMSDHVIFLENHVHQNAGPGLWCDINCRDVLYEGNTVERNSGPGIFHEISFNAVIRNNILRHNGMGAHRWFWNADIQIAASEHVEAYDNDITVSPGGGAIMLIDQGRAPEGSVRDGYKTRNNYVHHNRITFEGDGNVGGASDTLPWNDNYKIISEGQNRFDFNTYRLRKGASVAFPWGHRQFSWANFREQGQEQNGSLTAY